MNRGTLGAFALALSTLSVWIVATTACSSGGGDDPVVDTAPAVEADGGETPGGTSSPTGGDTTSPFDPLAPSTGDDPAPGTPPDSATDGAPDAEPSTADNGPEQQRPIGEGDDTASIAGLWDYSRMTDTGTDVVFFEIDAEGGLTEYDHQDDAVGSGATCNLVRRGSIASRGDDRYDIQDSSTLPGSASIDDVLITSDGAEITFRYLGEDADPQFGGGLIGVTESYPAATGRDVLEAAACDGDAVRG